MENDGFQVNNYKVLRAYISTTVESETTRWSSHCKGSASLWYEWDGVTPMERYHTIVGFGLNDLLMFLTLLRADSYDQHSTDT